MAFKSSNLSSDHWHWPVSFLNLYLCILELLPSTLHHSGSGSPPPHSPCPFFFAVCFAFLYLEVEDEAREGAEMMGWGRGEGRWRDHHEKIIEVRNGVCPEHKESFFHDEFFRVDVTQLTQMPTGLSRPHR